MATRTCGSLQFPCGLSHSPLIPFLVKPVIFFSFFFCNALGIQSIIVKDFLEVPVITGASGRDTGTTLRGHIRTDHLAHHRSRPPNGRYLFGQNDGFAFFAASTGRLLCPAVSHSTYREPALIPSSFSIAAASGTPGGPSPLQVPVNIGAFRERRMPYPSQTGIFFWL